MGILPSLELYQDIHYPLNRWDFFYLSVVLKSYLESGAEDLVVHSQDDEADILFTIKAEQQIKMYEEVFAIAERFSDDEMRRGKSLKKLKRQARESEKQWQERTKQRGWAKRELEQEKAMREKQQDGNE
tara:strand:+ start:1064 stop:1450 length:387 start_codon:yes stop_codon:yes gene_type:complete